MSMYLCFWKRENERAKQENERAKRSVQTAEGSKEWCLDLILCYFIEGGGFGKREEYGLKHRGILRTLALLYAIRVRNSDWWRGISILYTQYENRNNEAEKIANQSFRGKKWAPVPLPSLLIHQM